MTTLVAPDWKLVEEYLRQGRTIIGIDEVGRGAWAGPVVAGAVILNPQLSLPGVNDSKLVRAKARRTLDRDIRMSASHIGLGWVAPDELDEHGLSWAIAESGRRALEAMPTDNTVIILDGSWNYLKDSHEAITIVKADSLVLPVAAASLVAKVARDRYMETISKLLPGYGFERHVGYGTKQHQEALQSLGPSAAHRCSYTPVGATRMDV